MSIYSLIFQGIAIFLLAFFMIRLTIEYIGYRKVKRLYKNSDYTKAYIKKRIEKNIPLIPRKESVKHQYYTRLLLNAGWKGSIEYFYLLRCSLLILCIVFSISFYTTNVNLSMEYLKKDLTARTSLVESPLPNNPENIKNEVDMYEYLEMKYASSDEILNPSYRDAVLSNIQRSLQDSGFVIKEQPQILADRMYYKLVKIKLMKNNIDKYAFILLLSFIAYKIPIYLLHFKIRLMSNKMDWEVVNLMNIYTIFGSLPPYDILNILENMVIAADIYKPLITELYEGVKNGKGDEIFHEVMEKTENKDLFKLIEIMKMSRSTGIYSEVNKMNKRVESRLKKIEINNIRRRDSKLRYVMIPLAIMALFASLYFMLGTSYINNPSNLIQIK